MTLVVTSSEKRIAVDFGDYGPSLEILKGSWRKDGLIVKLKSDCVQVSIPYEKDWYVSHNETGMSMQIDSIDATAPTSAEHLYNLIVAIL